MAVCAWERELWWTHGYSNFEREHRDILDLLGVARAPAATKGLVEVR